MGDLRIAVQTQPIVIGVDIILEFFTDGQWEQLARDRTDRNGEVLFLATAPSLIGNIPFRAIAVDLSESTLAASEARTVSLTRREPGDVSITWPDQPLAYCEEAPVTVIAAVEARGAEALLAFRSDGTEQTIVDRSRLDRLGRATLVIPACDVLPEATDSSAQWAVRIPQHGIFSVFSSPWITLEVEPPPIVCPDPGPIPMTASNPDIGRSVFTVSNPSTQCQAAFTVTGDFFCTDGIAGDGFVLGRRTSSVYVITPGGSVTYLTDEVFTDSAASCRAQLPGGGLEFNLGTYSARAVAFTPTQ